MPNLNLSLAELAQQLRSQQTSATAIMQACAAKYAASETDLNAYKTWAGDTALTTAQQVDQLLKLGYDLGPLMGLPVSVKDMFAVPQLPTFAGTTTDLGSAWRQPGPLIQAVMQQLAPITGKTHTVEFALGGLGLNSHWGTPKNPWDTKHHRAPGGSSAGAGVSLCQGSALVALGTDTAGSVRIPAAMTGTVGLKTSVGRWPTAQIVPLSSSLDTPGILTNSAADAAYVFAALESNLHKRQFSIPALESCRGLRLGLIENFFWEDATPAVTSAVNQAARQLEQAGAQLVPLQVQEAPALYELLLQGGLSVAELAAYLEQFMPAALERLDPVVRQRIEDGGAISASEYLRRKHYLHQVSQQAQQLFSQVDLWLHPTLPITAPKLDDLQALDTYRKVNMLALRNPSIANFMGLCALSLPVGLDNQSLPIGMQLTAAANQEEKLLAAAQAIEQQLNKLK